MSTKTGIWQGPVTYTVAPMDDYDAMFGLEWLDEIRACIAPHSNSIYIYWAQTELAK